MEWLGVRLRKCISAQRRSVSNRERIGDGDSAASGSYQEKQRRRRHDRRWSSPRDRSTRPAHIAYREGPADHLARTPPLATQKERRLPRPREEPQGEEPDLAPHPPT